MENRPLVSIGVISYNNAPFIYETLQSVNNQDYDNLELIIVDDFSTDDSRVIIESWLPESKYPVKTIFHDSNKGVTAGCNSFLKNIDSSSAYLLVISSDDMLLPGRVKRQVALLEDLDKRTAGTFGDALIIDEFGKEIMGSYYQMMGRDFCYYEQLFQKKENKDIIKEIISHNCIPAMTVMYRTDVIKVQNGWNENLVIEDLDMNLRILRSGLMFFPTREKEAKHRKHSRSATTAKRVPYLTSILDIVSQYRGINDEIDTSIKRNYKEYALAVYQRGGKNAAPYLLQKFRFQKNAVNFIMYLLALAHIPFSWIRPFYTTLSRNKPL